MAHWSEYLSTLCLAEDSQLSKQNAGRLLAWKDTGELIVCINSVQSDPTLKSSQTDSFSLKLINVRKLKRELQDQAHVLPGDHVKNVVLDKALTGFHARQLCLSPEGSLLVIAGDHDIVLVKLQSTFKSMHGSGIRLGEAFHSTDRNNRIVKIDWHPLSSSHVLVLSSNGCLRQVEMNMIYCRMYDVLSSNEDPEQTFYFGRDPFMVQEHGFMNQGRVLTSNVEEMEAVSFSMGDKNDVWGALTVYGLMKSGDVYTVCPVLPRKSHISKEVISKLVADFESSWTEDDLQSRFDQSQYYWTRKWIKELQDAQVASSRGDTLKKPIFHPRSTGLLQLVPRCQGPFLMQPDVSQETRKEQVACDLVVLSLDPAPIMMIAYESGCLNVLVQVDRVKPVWSISEENENETYPSLASIEIIELGISRYVDNCLFIPAKQCLLTKDPRLYDRVYCQHVSGVHQISVAGLASFLKQPHQETVGGLCDVNWLLNTVSISSSDPCPVYGLVVVTDVFLGYTLITLCHQVARLFSFEISMRILPQEPLNATIGSKQESSVSFKFMDKPYQIPKPFEQTSKHSTLLSSSSKTYPMFVTQEVLKVLDEKTKNMRNEILMYYNAVDDVSEHHLRQQQEEKGQLQELQKLTKKLSQTIKPKNEQLLSRLDAINKRFRVLSRQGDTLLQLATDMAMPSQTPQEIAWRKELDKVDASIRTDLAPLLAQLQKQAAVISLQSADKQEEEEEVCDPIKRDAVFMGSAQLNRIYEALEAEKNIIVATSKQLSHIQGLIETIKLDA